MNSTLTTTNDGRIVSYVTDSNENRVGWIFQRGLDQYHVVMMDDRFADDEINHPHKTLDEAVFAGFLASHLFETVDRESVVEAEDRMEETVEFWDSVTMFA